MIPRKYHAIAFVSILVMLLLLGLHLLGFSLLGSGGAGQASSAAAASAALARNATTSSSSLLTPSGASSNSVYRHPIVYDKLTGATNNQISEVLGTSPKSTTDQYPIDHYQQQQQQQQQQEHHARLRNPFDQFANQDVVVDPFANMPGRQAFPPPPPPHGLGGPVSLRPPSPPPLPPHHRQLVPSHNLVHHNHHPHHMMTTQAPQQQQQDSLPSASSVNNNGAARPQANASNIAAQYYPNNQAQLQQQQQQPIYYTPPIFTYSNNNNNNFDLAQQLQPQVPPLGVPEVPLSVDEYNARQARLRQTDQLSNNDQQRQLQPQQQQQQQQQLSNKADKQQVNLLAEPEAQQRFKQQMLDRQLLFGGGRAPVQQQYTNYEHPGGYFSGPQTLTDNNFTSASYYPDPALYARLTGGQHQQQQQTFRPPYAHQMSDVQQQQQQLDSLKQMAPQNRVMAPPPPPQHTQLQPLQAAERQVVQSLPLRQSPPPPGVSSTIRAGQPPPTRLTPTQEAQPSCARQHQQQSTAVAALNSLELANSTGKQDQLTSALFCNEDAEYPTPDIMRALEMYATERSVELILPQPLVQMLTTAAVSNNGNNNNNSPKTAELQRQLSLDPLQANINAQTVASGTADEQQLGAGLFPSSNYESMCKAVTWMAQPRRAKNLLGRWKVIVNLPGHKYRGIAISQMVRIEECTRPNSECSSSSSPPSSSPSPAPSSGSAVTTTRSTSTPAPAQAMPRSRCLQLYDNQRLLAWSHQQGLHFDIFRMPSACSCHNRRF